jgi:hypothetical protein
LQSWDDDSGWSDDGWDDVEKGPGLKLPSLDVWNEGSGVRQGSGFSSSAHVSGLSPRGGTPASRARAAAAASSGGNSSPNRLQTRKWSDASDGW